MSSHFDILSTSIAGINVLQRTPIGDSRGYLERLFCLNELHPLLNGKNIVQINHTLTTQIGTIRGMHFQFPPWAEIKFVTCLRGKVFDVAVDIRHNSPTFLQWHGEVLSENNRETLVITEGFAHGFQSLTDNCELLYFHTNAYHSDAEAGLDALDPVLSIQWPHPVARRSSRDLGHSLLTDDFSGVIF
jgi:dTDP-4-dehydrorhamnose 3,5-epimerase